MSNATEAEVRTKRSRSRFDPRRLRIGYKLGVSMLLLAVVPLLLLATFGAQRLRTEARDDGRTDLTAAAAAVALSVDAEIEANKQLASLLGVDQRVIEFAKLVKSGEPTRDSAEVTALMERAVATHPSVGAAAISGLDGVTVASTLPELVGMSLGMRTFVQDAFNGHASVSDVFLPVGVTDDKPGTAFAAPIKSSSGEILGVVSIKNDALTISDKLTESSHGVSYLIESTGLIASHPDSQNRFKSLVEFSDAEQKEGATTRSFKEPVETVDADDNVRAIVGAANAGFTIGHINNQRLALAWQPLEGTDWVAVATRPYSELDAAAAAAFTDALRFAGFVAVIAGVLAALAALALGKPISLLTAAARRLGTAAGLEDDLPLERLTNRSDDLGVLADQLVVANRHLKERERRATEQVRALKVEIDQIRRETSVGEIVESEFFADLEARAVALRRAVRKQD